MSRAVISVRRRCGVNSAGNIKAIIPKRRPESQSNKVFGNAIKPIPSTSHKMLKIKTLSRAFAFRFRWKTRLTALPAALFAVILHYIVLYYLACVKRHFAKGRIGFRGLNYNSKRYASDYRFKGIRAGKIFEGSRTAAIQGQYGNTNPVRRLYQGDRDQS